jgi:hypothetical protein
LTAGFIGLGVFQQMASGKFQEIPSHERNLVESFYVSGIVEPGHTLEQILQDEVDVTRSYALDLKTQNIKLTNLVTKNSNKLKDIIDYDKLSAPRYLLELLERMSAKHGFPTICVPYCIIKYESNFDPTCWNQNGEDSRGLFQVNLADKSHRKRNPNKTKLFDPAYNMEYQLDELYTYYQQGKAKGLSGVELVKYTLRFGQRPRWTKTVEQAIEKAYKEYQDAVVKGVSR